MVTFHWCSVYVSFLHLSLLFHFSTSKNLECTKQIIWASSWDYGTYHIGDQRRLRRACTSAQSRKSLRCSHTLSMEVDEGSDQNQTSSPIGWLRMRVWRMSLRRTKSTIISWDGSYEEINKVNKICSYQTKKNTHKNIWVLICSVGGINALYRF